MVKEGGQLYLFSVIRVSLIEGCSDGCFIAIRVVRVSVLCEEEILTATVVLVENLVTKRKEKLFRSMLFWFSVLVLKV